MCICEVGDPQSLANRSSKCNTHFWFWRDCVHLYCFPSAWFHNPNQPPAVHSVWKHYCGAFPPPSLSVSGTQPVDSTAGGGECAGVWSVYSALLARHPACLLITLHSASDRCEESQQARCHRTHQGWMPPPWWSPRINPNPFRVQSRGFILVPFLFVCFTSRGSSLFLLFCFVSCGYLWLPQRRRRRFAMLPGFEFKSNFEVDHPLPTN